MLSGLQQLAVWTAFFIGVMVADLFLVQLQFYVVALLLALLFGLLWRKGFLHTVTACVWVCLLLVGVIRMEWAEQSFLDSSFSPHVGSEVEVTGVVIREPDVREQFQQVYVNVEQEVLLVRTNRFHDIAYGDTVAVSGELASPESFETDTGRLFNYPNYLKARGVQHIVSFADVTVIERGGGYTLWRWLFAVKETFAASITDQLQPPQSDLGLGLLLGIKQALGDDLEQAFRRSGLIHIVVLSGYNVMLVIAFFWWVTSWVLPLRGRVVVSLVGIILFAIMVGLSATVVRASIMAGILLLAKFIGTRYDVLRALLFAGFVMVLINPYVLLYDLGFQLSFMATLGLVLFLPQFESTVVTETKAIGLKDIFLATVVTQLFVLPLLMFHIGEVSLVAVLVNVLVLPIVAGAMFLTFVSGLLGLLSTTLALPVALLANLVLSYIILVVTWFNQLPFAAITVSSISLLELLGLYVLLGLVWYWWQRQSKNSASALSSELPILLR